MRFFPPSLGAALAAALFAGGLVQAGPAAAAGATPRLPTPSLIERAVKKGRIDRDRGNLYLAYALARPDRLPVRYRSDVPWDGTVPLFMLRGSLAKMPAGPERRAVARTLGSIATPTACGPSSSTLPDKVETPHFYIEYDAAAFGGGQPSAHIQSLTTSWTKEVDDFGWAPPPVSLTNPPPNGKYHVRVQPLGSGLYGFVSSTGTHAGFVGNNPDTLWDDIDAHATCMVLRDDYSGFPSSAQASLDATAAHEFNHSIQFGYGALHGSIRPDWVFVEGGATWMEDEVFDTANDNYYFLWPAFAESMGDYDASFFGYEYWITFRGLTERFGTGSPGGAEQIMQDFWEETSRNSGNNLTALQTALANRGTTLADAFHEYAIAVKFNKPCVSGYAYPYCLREGPDYMASRGPTNIDGVIGSTGGSYIGTIEDNYSINWIRLPTGSAAYAVKLINAAAGGQLRGSVVCDTGFSLTATPLPAVVAAGASAQLSTFDPSGCVSVVAVITNQAQTAPNPASSETRSYLLSTDATPPTAPTLAGAGISRPFQTQKDIELSWGVEGGGYYDIRHRSASENAGFGNFFIWLAHTPATVGLFTGAPGRTYCFSARATDAALNTSEYGAETCTAVPVNNTSLTHRGPWAKKKGKGYFLGTVSMSSANGASLVLPKIHAKRLAIVVTKCPGCGTIKVFFRNKLLRTIRLGGGSIRKKQVVDLATFKGLRSGTLRAVVASSGRPVKIEGVGVSQA